MKYYLNVELLRDKLRNLSNYKGIIVGSLTTFTEGAYIPDNDSVRFSDDNKYINSDILIDGDGALRRSSWKIPTEFLIVKEEEKEKVTLEI